MRRHPDPSPPPQAGEGVQQRKAPYRLMRDTAELLKHFNLICPVQSHMQKYFSSPLTQITCISPAVPSHTEGRYAIVTDVGRGMRWTQAALLTRALALGPGRRGGRDPGGGGRP